MTSPDDAPRDGSRDDPAKGTPDEPDASFDLPFDEEAAWRLIVENYGDRPHLDDDPEGDDLDLPDVGPADLGTASAGTGAVDPAADGRLGSSVFDRSPRDADDPDPDTRLPDDHPSGDRPDDWDELPRGRRRTDEPDRDLDRDLDRELDRDHYVPPEPPPVPRGTPARRLAWAGLFVPPVLMIVAVVFGWVFPTWLSMGLVAAFVGGFVFLVVTMPRDGGDGWGDGAVV
jgi:hypothetical protein